MKLIFPILAAATLVSPAFASDVPATLQNKRKLASFLSSKGLPCQTVQSVSEGETEKRGRTFRVQCVGDKTAVYGLILRPSGHVLAERPPNYRPSM